jgi:hypothetical protein
MHPSLIPTPATSHQQLSNEESALSSLSIYENTEKTDKVKNKEKKSKTPEKKSIDSTRAASRAHTPIIFSPSPSGVDPEQVIDVLEHLAEESNSLDISESVSFNPVSQEPAPVNMSDSHRNETFTASFLRSNKSAMTPVATIRYHKKFCDSIDGGVCMCFDGVVTPREVSPE